MTRRPLHQANCEDATATKQMSSSTPGPVSWLVFIWMMSYTASVSERPSCTYEMQLQQHHGRYPDENPGRLVDEWMSIFRGPYGSHRFGLLNSCSERLPLRVTWIKLGSLPNQLVYSLHRFTRSFLPVKPLPGLALLASNLAAPFSRSEPSTNSTKLICERAARDTSWVCFPADSLGYLDCSQIPCEKFNFS